jgi:hypothetical protein
MCGDTRSLNTLLMKEVVEKTSKLCYAVHKIGLERSCPPSYAVQTLQVLYAYMLFYNGQCIRYAEFTQPYLLQL